MTCDAPARCVARKSKQGGTTESLSSLSDEGIFVCGINEHMRCSLPSRSGGAPVNIESMNGIRQRFVDTASSNKYREARSLIR